MKTLRPIRDYDHYSSPIARAIFKMWDEMIYTPLMSFLKERELAHAKTSALVDALKRGSLEYRDGYFVGHLNVAISKAIRELGGKWNKVRKVYYLDIAQMPQEILKAIQEGNQASRAVQGKVYAYLRAIEGRETKVPDIDVFLGDTLKKLDTQFFKTTKPITGQDLEIPFDEKLSGQLKEAYTTNLDKYIKKWNDEAILRLREKVEQNARAGFRAERLISQIQAERGVSYRKAKFLAKQETSLMTSSYREIRYRDIDITHYIWSSSHDSRVRPLHRELNGHLFSFDHPPICDSHTGERGNPGEAYGCRCIAVPYIKGGINFMEPKQQLMESTK